MLTTDDTIERLFCDALEKPPELRSAFLDGTCGGDPVLRAEIETLLAAQASAGDFLRAPAISIVAFKPSPAASELPAGCRIGRYTIVRRLGIGGMATVYEAIQDQPRRPVAIKIMRTALGSGRAIRRFQFEAEVLGRLEHPGIARLYEAGVWDYGGLVAPFFAMELLVDARPIDSYVAARRLSLRQRVELMAIVCDTVHYGHQRGVIHRDLKPSNLLVDAGGAPKVIDFGIARAVENDVAGPTLHTSDGALVGTLAYMSPEQFEVCPDQIDVRSDVFSLGVVLYQLLCDAMPFDLRGQAIVGAARIVKEQPPARPACHNARLRGDLETILLKALEKDRRQRYASASELAADLRRFLCDEPVAARAPSALYQLRKLARRHRALTGGGLLAVAGLVLGAVVAGWYAARAADERNRAVAAQGHATREAIRAAAEADAAVRVANCLSRVLSVVGHGASGGLNSEDLPAREVLDQATAAVAGELTDQPLAQANLFLCLGDAYRRRGLHGQARDVWTAAFEIRKSALAWDSFPLAESAECLGIACYDLGDYDAAERVLREAAAAFGNGSPQRQIRRGFALHALGEVLSIRGRMLEAVPHFQETLEIRRRVQGESHWSYGSTLFRLTLAQVALNDRQAVAARQLDAQRLRELSYTLPEPDPHRSGAPLLLGIIALGLGDSAAAEPLLREALVIRARQLGTEAYLTTYAENALGACLSHLGRSEEAESLLVRSTRSISTKLPPGNVQVGECVKRTIEFYQQTGRPDLARSYEALLPHRDGD